MTSPSSLLALEGKLVEAKGPDREIDFALYEGVGLATLDRNAGIWRWTIPSGGRHSDNSVPAYTSSIDAALALVSRVRADKMLWALTCVGESDYRAALSDGQGKAPTAALAICLALIRSLKGAGQ